MSLAWSEGTALTVCGGWTWAHGGGSGPFAAAASSVDVLPDRGRDLAVPLPEGR
ncbi:MULTISPECIES: hypothetical protein [unclassified Streptomyces]|uniref:hypothetical protein n=1 Tax=unclassified Streptomyces TaxID=2593676 RepID=UPI0038301C49